jgi:translation initiation factor IF-3
MPFSPAGASGRGQYTGTSPKGGYSVVLEHGHGSGCAFCMLIIWRCYIIANKELQLNEEIRDKEVRLVGPEGEQLGILPIADARRIANERELDLVNIAPQAKPPVCKVMDYGKYRFEQAKREKEARKNQKIIELKEIRLSLNIDTHDFNTKLKNAIKFLQAGNKLKVSIRFRGREMTHPQIGQDMMKHFSEEIAGYGTIDRLPKMEGRSMIMFVTTKTPK